MTGTVGQIRRGRRIYFNNHRSRSLRVPVHLLVQYRDYESARTIDLLLLLLLLLLVLQSTYRYSTRTRTQQLYYLYLQYLSQSYLYCSRMSVGSWKPLREHFVQYNRAHSTVVVSVGTCTDCTTTAKNVNTAHRTGNRFKSQKKIHQSIGKEPWEGHCSDLQEQDSQTLRAEGKRRVWDAENDFADTTLDASFRRGCRL
jgi:hypothetical protein